MAEVKMTPVAQNEDDKPEKLEKVIKGEIVKKKAKPALLDEFVKEEPSYVKEYLLGEVVLPAVKNLIYELGDGALSMFLFGEVRGGRGRRDDRTRYSSRGSGSYRGRDYDDDYDRVRRRPRDKYTDFSDIVMSSRADAITVLNDLKDQIEDYGCATVANFYELVGEDSGHMDTKYGWENLDRAYVDSVRGGFIIEFPKARYLD